MQVSDKVGLTLTFKSDVYRILRIMRKMTGDPKLLTVLTWISKDLVSDLLMMTAVICNKAVSCTFVKIA